MFLSEIVRTGLSLELAFQSMGAKVPAAPRIDAVPAAVAADAFPFYVGAHVFEDANRNGRFDTGEQPLGYFGVQLLKNGATVGDAATDANGIAGFTVDASEKLDTQGYHLSFATQADGMVACEFTGDKSGADYTPIRDNNGTEVGRIWNAPFDCDMATTRVVVCEDGNGNGACLDPEDKALAGLVVNAYHPGDAITPEDGIVSLDEAVTNGVGTATLETQFVDPIAQVSLPENCTGQVAITHQEDGSQIVSLPVVCAQ